MANQPYDGPQWQDNGNGTVSQRVALTGSYVRLSTEPKPTVADGVKDGNDLFLIDTQEVFIYYSGEWRAI